MATRSGKSAGKFAAQQRSANRVAAARLFVRASQTTGQPVPAKVRRLANEGQ